jgi:tRNA (guanine26-N2/guanine27-N2)-dimethyltransferase
MAGCGVRAVRYALESQANYVWANDGNPELDEILQHNLGRSLPSAQYHITQQEANRLLLNCYCHQDFYDLVDVDCFGSPAPYLSACLGAATIGGLVYITSTDGRTATGHAPNNCLSDYGAYVRVHPAGHEQGLRLLIGQVQQLAAAKGFGVEPIFSFFKGQIYRVMVRLVTRSGLTPENYSYLGYCHHCGNYQTIAWRDLGRTACSHDGKFLVASGPLWLGQLHDSTYLQDCIALAEQWNWKAQARLLRLMQTEAEMPPYFYPLGEIGRRGQMDIPKRVHLTRVLQNWGYRVSSTHIHREAIKTDADVQTCIRAAKSIAP